MEKGKLTVAKELYRILAEYGDFMPSGALERLHVLNATGSTITRKLRLLESSRFIEVKHVDGHSHYRALKTYKERLDYTPEAPQKPLNVPEKPAEPKVVHRYVPVFEKGNPRPVAMREVVETT